MSVIDLDEIHIQVIGVAGEIQEQSTMLAMKLDHIIHLLQVLTNDKPANAEAGKVRIRRDRRQTERTDR
jgi:hypothetical protein